MPGHLVSSPPLLLSYGPFPICLSAKGSNSKSLRSRNAAAVCPSPPGWSKAPPGRPPLQAQSRLLTPGTFLPNAWVVAFLAYFTPPLPTDHIAQFRSFPPPPSPPLPSPLTDGRIKARKNIEIAKCNFSPETTNLLQFVFPNRNYSS